MTQCPLCKGEADGLTFNALRNANIARLPLFKNSKGEPAHSDPQRYQTHNEGDAMTDRPRPMYCEIGRAHV